MGNWKVKVGSQEIPGVTGKFGQGVQNETEQKLMEFCQENTLVIANTLFQQHEKALHMNITRWSIQNHIDYILCSQRWRSSIQSAKTRPGADCGSDHELLIAKFSSVIHPVRLFATPWMQHARPPWPSPTPRVYWNSCPLSWWCHPTISSSVNPSLPAFNLSQHQGLFNWVSSSHQVAKVSEFQLQHQSFQWIFRTDFL